ncbi:MAG: hypothetical protein AB7E79_02810 [Rhodospirillaceae bacterium]
MTALAAEQDQLTSIVVSIDAARKSGDWASVHEISESGLEIAPGKAGLHAARIEAAYRLKRWRAMYRACVDMFEKVKIPEPHLTQARPDEEPRAYSFTFADSRLRVYLLVLAAVIVGLAAGSGVQWGTAGALWSTGGLLGVLTVTEALYRWHLYASRGIAGERHAYPGKIPGGQFAVNSAVAYVPNPVRGYDLKPDTRFVRILVDNGRVVDAHTATTDRNGNVGFTDTEADENALTIAVFGDSYTSFPGNGATIGELEGVEWPFFMKRALNKGGLNARVLNYGRSGHGVRQMFDTAADVVDRHKVNLVIIAFIIDDLDRHRMWFEAREIGGKVRSFRRIGKDAPFHEWAEQEIIDERVTMEWARERLEKGDSDALLQDLVATYNHRVRRMSGVSIDLLSARRLYSWDYLFFGTPFIDRNPLSARISWQKTRLATFRDDPQFVAAVEKISASGAQLMMCHIPRKAEMKQRRILPSSPFHPSLAADLQALTGEGLLSLHEMFAVAPELVETQYARKPHDEHPSLWTMVHIGASVARQVMKKIARRKAVSAPSVSEAAR